MKQLLRSFLPLLLLCSSVASAQTIEIKYGPEQRIDQEKAISAFAFLDEQYAEDDEFIYSRKVDGYKYKSMVIEKVKKSDGKSVWKKKLPVDAYNRRTHIYFCDLGRIANGFILFVKKENAKLKQSYLTAQKLDEDLKPMGEEKIVATSKSRDEVQNSYLFEVRKDGNKYLLYGHYENVMRYHYFKNESYSFSAIDNDLNIIWQKEISLPGNRFYELAASEFDAGGNLITLFKVSTNGKKLNDKSAAYEYVVYTYNYGKDIVQSKEITWADKLKYVSHIIIQLDVKESAAPLGIYGIYSNRPGKDDDQEGVFSIEFDLKKMEITRFDVIPFTAEMLAKYLGPKDAAKGKLPSDLAIEKKIKHNNGEVSFILEARRVVTYNHKSFISTRYYFDDILVLTVKEDGKLGWFSYIPKKQSGNTVGYFSVYAFSEDNTLILLFNAFDKSVISSGKSVAYTSNDNANDEHNVLVATMFDKKGETVAKTFTPGADKKMTVNMNTIRKVGDGKYAFSCEQLNASGRIASTVDATLEVK